MKKKILITLCLLGMKTIVWGQDWEITFHFENDTEYPKYFYIDSADTENIWQIGKPGKSVFSEAYTIPNALVTDTINTYPVNNTSSVFLRHIVNMMLPIVQISYLYRIHSDTLTDYAKIECTVDKGLSWINLSDSAGPFHFWAGGYPMFSGDSKGWKYAFSLYFWFDNHYQNPFNLNNGDTILFKFTFTSDSIDTGKDGWMIDYFIKEPRFDLGSIPDNEFESSSNNYMYLFCKGNGALELVIPDTKHINDYHLQIFDLTGRRVFTSAIEKKNINVFTLYNIKDGIYLYNICKGTAIKQKGKIYLIN